MQKLAGPNPLLMQLVRHFFEGRSRHLGLEKLLLAPAYRLLRPIAIQLLAASIPFENAAAGFPYENGHSRQLHEAFLLEQLAFAVPQRLLHMTPLRDIDECDDDAIDLVIDGAVRTHAHVVPEIVAATDLQTNRHKIREYFPHVLDQ